MQQIVGLRKACYYVFYFSKVSCVESEINVWHSFDCPPFSGKSAYGRRIELPASH